MDKRFPTLSIPFFSIQLPEIFGRDKLYTRHSVTCSMYHKILVPYDGSKPSVSALKHAIELAAVIGKNVEITLVYVMEKILLPPLSSERIRSPRSGEVMDREQLLKQIYYDQKKSATEMLERATHSIVPGRVRAHLKVLYGSAPEEIVQYASRAGTDLIVIGNIGLSGISKLKALGSVSRCVSECAPCPVLIVH